MKPKTAIYLGVIITLLSAIGTAKEVRAEDKLRVEIYGFVQLDAIYDFNRVDPQWNATLRPSKILPAPGTQFGENGETIFSVKQSRLGVNGYIPTDLGEVKTKFEFDMFGVGNHAGETTIRLRHAYGEIGQFLAGQTNSLFMDGDVYPNTIDYWGPAGMIFFRNIQARWTFLNQGGTKAAVALESPGSAVDTGKLDLIDPNLAANVHSWNKYPDFTGQFRKDGTWGHVQLAGIVRWLGYDTTDKSASGHKTGWGGNLSGAVHTTGKDSVMAQVAYGEGIANYFNDGGVDLAPRTGIPGGGAEAVPILGVLLYYDKYWNDKWSSSIGYSETAQHNAGGQTATAFHKGQYASANLLHYPTKNVMVGGEFLYGKLEQNGGESGHDYRVQFSTKFNF